MQIEAKKVVSIEYTLKDTQGQLLDKSADNEPLTYLHGTGNMVPGVEKALDGKSPGDTVQVTVAPAEAYGERNDHLVTKIAARKLPGKKAKIGDRFRVETEQGPMLVTVVKIVGDYATIDANHPLAGMTLQFDLKVVDVRDATAEELEHGHVHGAGGHHH